MEIKSGQIWKHFKGFEIKIICIAKHSETEVEHVVYDHMGSDSRSEFWVRPKDMFLENVERDGKIFPRFEFLRDN